MKFSTRTLLALLATISIAFSIQAQETNRKIAITGRVKSAITKIDLTESTVYIVDDDGNPTDSVRANMGLTYRNGVVDTMSYFYLRVPAIDSVYNLRITCPDYKTVEMPYELTKIGRREQHRDLGILYLERAPQTLKELTVTSSKIKFYHKGDTIVYNADAFQLAEGSMLDALIAQLPGAELNSNGQIKINGEFVESLLLNGKEFFDGNNNLMLDNIAAYTVKDVQVYEAQSLRAQRELDAAAPKKLTMDVRLKKEYMMGWLVNALGGYGTDDRYIGKLFASWFNTTTRISLVGNANNLNDNRKPGRNDTWTPEMLPSGRKEYQNVGLNYNYQDADETKYANGDLEFARSTNNVNSTSNRINFLPGGDTYEYSYSRNNFTETRLSTSHWLQRALGSKDWRLSLALNGNYNRTKNTDSALSGAFHSDQQDMSMEILDAIYTNAKPGQLEEIINCAKTDVDGWSRSLSGGINPYISWKLPQSNDNMFLRLGANYSSTKSHTWNGYLINYGADPTPAVTRLRYTDNNPNHKTSLTAGYGYNMRLSEFMLMLSYNYDFRDEVKDSNSYALERLNQMGIYGILPEGYLDSFDPANSYRSRLLTNRHNINPYLAWLHTFKDEKAHLQIQFNPNVSIEHRHLDYWRNNQDYQLSKTHATVSISSIWSGMIELNCGYRGEGRQRSSQYSLRYSYRINPTLPGMTDMLDIVDDSNPLNIYVGNPDLRTENEHRHLFRFSYKPFGKNFNNILYLGYNHTSNALTRGYVYNTETGVRLNRMYNVDGNHSGAITNELSWQFGSQKQFTLSSETDFNVSTYADMIGINSHEPELTKVKNRMFNEKLMLGWHFGKQSLQLRGDYMNRHTTSTQTGFSTLNANHAAYGIIGTFTLPAGFGINTDFMCYTRRGYGTSTLDTTDPIWNARLSYCPPRNSRWVFMVDGFDLLHKLSNVNYAVTASGRTVSYTNSLPRYIMFSVQYRLSIQPKKR